MFVSIFVCPFLLVNYSSFFVVEVSDLLLLEGCCWTRHLLCLLVRQWQVPNVILLDSNVGGCAGAAAGVDATADETATPSAAAPTTAGTESGITTVGIFTPDYASSIPSTAAVSSARPKFCSIASCD